MMGKWAAGEKWMVGNMIKNGDNSNNHQNVPCLGLFIQQSECSSGSSSSSNSNGFNNDREIFNDVQIPPNDPYFIPNRFSSNFMAPISEYSNGGLHLDSKPTHISSSYKINDRFVDEMSNLSQRFNGINIGGDQVNFGTKMKGFDAEENGFGFGFSDYNAKEFGFGAFSNVVKKDSYNSLMGSSFSHNLSNNNCSSSGWYTNQSDYLFDHSKEKGGKRINWDSQFQSQIPLMEDPYLVDSNFRANGIQIPNNGYSHPIRSMESPSCEDSFILQGGKSLNPHFYSKGCKALYTSEKMNDLNEISVRGKSIKLDNPSYDGLNWLDIKNSMAASICSLSEIQGNIYLMAQDQNGCRWLQRILEEGTKDDIQIVFKEFGGHVVELMLKPFGNYVIQKFLDVCDEKQRLKIVMSVTEKPGQLVRICLSTYGTRAIQKLIETLKTRQQISFVIMALRPGFLDLVKDQNGNHVIQRCLQCLSSDDNKFIFEAAARFCVEIACHRHGCCVMQRCITHSTGRSREKLVTEISKNSLLLAQDPFGNYVIQYIVQLKSPSAVVNLLSQFKGHYVHLSMQKFSSHVVEKCLHYLEESQEQIVRELISVSRFEHLVQDPFANYVIQSALAVTKGRLHSLLVEAVRPHMILRTNPYSKRIFSRNLMKK